MDLRIQRTRRSIADAFLKLRAEKPLEKITIKELSELALINKATFYSHYEDIYDLAEQLENETIDRILEKTSHPETFITNPKEATADLAKALFSQSEVINTLFSGSRASALISKLEKRIKNKTYEYYPEYQKDLESDILLTVLIQGGFHAFTAYANLVDTDRLIEIVGTLSDRILTQNLSKR